MNDRKLSPNDLFTQCTWCKTDLIAQCTAVIWHTTCRKNLEALEPSPVLGLSMFLFCFWSDQLRNDHQLIQEIRNLICHLKTCISACSRFRPIERGSKGLLENPTTYLHSTESHTGPLIIIRKRKLKHSTQLLLYGEHLGTYQRKHPVTHLQPLVVNFSLSPHPSQLFPLLPQPSVHSFHFIMLLFLNLASSKRHSPI